jgi:hypothetical protein
VIRVGDPAFVTVGVFYGVNISTSTQLDQWVTLVETTVRTDASATPRLYYKVRNNNQVGSSTFRRTTVQISP